MKKGFNIYKFEDSYIFTGFVYIYIERYKGIGPAYYRYPILKLPADCSVDELHDALVECDRVLEENLPMIEQDNAEHVIMAMDKILFDNFKQVGIKASRLKILRNSILVNYFQKQQSVILKSTYRGGHMMVDKEVLVEDSMTLRDIAEIMKGFLEEGK